jgi:ectoine hydroxylase-related dioxygenase (phytanoyl-CoA dioxygenase family)
VSVATASYVADYLRDGYAIVRGVFSAEEVEAIGEAVDRVHAEGVQHGRSFRHGNLFYNVALGADGLPQVRMVQWPSYHQPMLNKVRLDRRMAALMEPLLGRDLKQIINQIHWKAPGAKGDFAWHQDSRFREPGWAYRNLGSSYVQTGLAIDPHRPESGCMRFIRGSHLRGNLDLDSSTEVLGTSMSDSVVLAAGLSPGDAVDLVLDPGDLALWSPFLVHGSGTNGEPVPFGPEPALVHYEALRERGEPHYV